MYIGMMDTYSEVAYRFEMLDPESLMRDVCKMLEDCDVIYTRNPSGEWVNNIKIPRFRFECFYKHIVLGFVIYS